jgi:hypothetical protein
MKTHLLLITFALSGSAWAAEPAATTPTTAPATTAAPVESGAPDTQAAAPASTEAKPAAATQQAAPAVAADQNAAEAAEQAGFSRGSVVRSVFTTEVKDREPVDKLNGTKSDAEHIYFYTELRDMSGQTATHRWEHNGKVAAEVKFNVRGPRWRVWSSKTFAPNAEGEWKVSVLNGAGEVIAEDIVDYSGPVAGKSPAASEQPAAAEHAAPTQAIEPPVTDMMQK